MTSSATGRTPAEFGYRIVLSDDFVVFGDDGMGMVGVTVTMTRGAPLHMFDFGSDAPVTLGIRIFRDASAPDEAPSRGEKVTEFRASSPPVTLDNDRSQSFSVSVDLRAQDRDRYIAVPDLVCEGQFWFENLGHACTEIPIRPRFTMATYGDAAPESMARAHRTERERIRREERYEAIIFSLLGTLRQDG